jgi:hypothetical protein
MPTKPFCSPTHVIAGRRSKALLASIYGPSEASLFGTNTSASPWTRWITKIQPALKNAKLSVLVKECGKSLSRRKLIELLQTVPMGIPGEPEICAALMRSYS